MQALFLCIFSSSLALVRDLHCGHTQEAKSVQISRVERSLDWLAGHQLKLNTLSLLRDISVIFQMRVKGALTCFTDHLHERQTMSQVLDENPHYSSHKSAPIPQERRWLASVLEAKKWYIHSVIPPEQLQCENAQPESHKDGLVILKFIPCLFFSNFAP